MTLPPPVVMLPLPDRPVGPGLYLVATPIGNLADMTLRALATLHAADLILCEDTRVTGKLLTHYDIHKPLRVYNEQTEGRSHADIIQKIQQGSVVVLVSDAGMPLLSDPGYQLVRACVAAGVTVTSVPGASAILTGLQLSGLPSDAFLFLGFLPNKRADRQRRLVELRDVPATLILFERASRVPDVLNDIQASLGDRKVAVARELTKLFEDVRRGTVTQVLADIAARPIKGEVVLLVDRPGEKRAVTDDDIITHLRTALKHETRRGAVDLVVGITGVPRRRVYDLALGLKDE